MERLISADRLTEKIKSWIPKDGNWDESSIHPVEDLVVSVIMEIEEAPTVDAVPVVRCKDCLYSYKVDSREPKYDCRHICRMGCIQWLGSDDFCSYGERKGNGKGD